MTYPSATVVAPAGADVVAMVLDQYVSIVHRYAATAAGDVAALRRAASVVHAAAGTVGTSAGDLTHDVTGVGEWHGSARDAFDRTARTQVHRLELVSDAAGRCANAMDAVVAAMVRAAEQMSLVNTWIEQAKRVLTWVARIPGVDPAWVIGIAYRTGERAVAFADSVRRELEAKLAEFAATVQGVVGSLAHDFPVGDAAGSAAHPHPLTTPTTPTSASTVNNPTWTAESGARAAATPIDGSRLPQQYQQYLPYVQAAARRYDLDPALIMAVMDRETGSPRVIGNGGNNILGDGGHGHGLMQIDDRSHAPWLQAHDNGLDPESNINYGASILRSNLDRFDGNTQAALAAYNSGGGNVHHLLQNGQDPDARTAGHNYGADTLRRYDWFRQQIGQ